MPRKSESGKWIVDVRPDGARGKRIRKQFASFAEANRFEAFVMGEALSGKPWNPAKGDKRSFGKLLERWFQLHGQSLKDGSSRLRKLQSIDDALGNPIALDVTARTFTDYRAKRLSDGSTANTCNHELAYMKAVFNELERVGEWAHGNPLKQVRAIKFDEPVLTWLTREQIMRLLDACAESDNLSLLPQVIVCLVTGARWGEASSLTVGQVRNGKISFHATKSGKSRTVPFESAVITEWVRGRHGRLFKECTGAFRKAIERAEIELPRGQLTHVCRHTFASHYMQNGGDILTLQKILGHASLTMTMRYAHFSPDHLADVPRRSPLANLHGQFLDSPHSGRV